MEDLQTSLSTRESTRRQMPTLPPIKLLTVLESCFISFHCVYSTTIPLGVFHPPIIVPLSDCYCLVPSQPEIAEPTMAIKVLMLSHRSPLVRNLSISSLLVLTWFCKAGKHFMISSMRPMMRSSIWWDTFNTLI